MNGKSRFLPRLNLCYLQKKAYEIHLKKMNNILNQSRNTQKTLSRSFDSHQKLFREKGDKSVVKLNPYQKKVLKETEKENMRLFQAIQKCPSTISRKTLSQQTFMNEQIKQRIKKYAILPGSNRALLKCQISLDKLSKKQRQNRYSTFQTDSKAKSSSKLRCTKTGLSQNRSQLESSKLNNYSDRGQKFQLRRNKNKVKNHFKRNELTLRTKQKLQGFRESIQHNKRMHDHPIYKWKTRCFTTQMEQRISESQ